MTISAKELDGRAAACECDQNKTTYTLRAHGAYVLEIQISQGDRPQTPTDVVERLLIEDGEEPTEPVEMRVQVESFYDLRLGADQVRSFSRHPHQNEATYRFHMSPQNSDSEPVQLFINVYQNAALVHVVRLHLLIVGNGSSDV